MAFLAFSFALVACFIAGMMMAHYFREWRRDLMEPGD